jgi:biotin carboxyl carrier protein
MDNPHLLIGWISKIRSEWSFEGEKFQWNINPLTVLADLYHYLNMDYEGTAPALEVIWDHDRVILEQGLRFYKDLEQQLGSKKWSAWQKILTKNQAPKGIESDIWKEVLAAHEGFQLGLELLAIVVKSSLVIGFDDLSVTEDLTISIPESLKDPEITEHARKILVPPPLASTNEIVAVSGGMFYAQETPGGPHFLEVGTHFDVGDPLYIIEVMKMFNKEYAEFSGTVTEVLIERGDGLIVQKGQPLYRIEPDEFAEVVDEKTVAQARLTHTIEQLSGL